MNEIENVTTIADECILLGAPSIITKNGGYLANLINQVAKDYDSPNFDGVTLLANIMLAKDNCATIIEAAEVCKAVLEKLRNELTAQ